MSDDAYNYVEGSDDIEEMLEVIRSSVVTRSKVGSMLLDFALCSKDRGDLNEDEFTWCIVISTMIQAENALHTLVSVSSQFRAFMRKGMEVSLLLAMGI